MGASPRQSVASAETDRSTGAGYADGESAIHQPEYLVSGLGSPPIGRSFIGYVPALVPGISVVLRDTAEMLQAESIPMKGRMIHHLSPTVSPESQLYDPRGGQVGHSLSRPILNQRLVEALPDGVKTRFRTKLSRIDFRKRLAWGRGAEGGKAYKLGDEAGGSRGDSSDGKKEQAGEDQEGTSFDLVVGADGSWSKVRSEMMHVER